jgi:hypothetical protein
MFINSVPLLFPLISVAKNIGECGFRNIKLGMKYEDVKTIFLFPSSNERKWDEAETIRNEICVRKLGYIDKTTDESVSLVFTGPKFGNKLVKIVYIKHYKYSSNIRIDDIERKLISKYGIFNDSKNEKEPHCPKFRQTRYGHLLERILVWGTNSVPPEKQHTKWFSSDNPRIQSEASSTCLSNCKVLEVHFVGYDCDIMCDDMGKQFDINIIRQMTYHFIDLKGFGELWENRHKLIEGTVF